MTPFGADSSAVSNVLWGSANAATAGILAWRYRQAIEGVTLAVSFGTSVVLALTLASYWSAEEPRLPWE